MVAGKWDPAAKRRLRAGRATGGMHVSGLWVPPEGRMCTDALYVESPYSMFLRALAAQRAPTHQPVSPAPVRETESRLCTPARMTVCESENQEAPSCALARVCVSESRLCTPARMTACESGNQETPARALAHACVSGSVCESESQEVPSRALAHACVSDTAFVSERRAVQSCALAPGSGREAVSAAGSLSAPPVGGPGGRCRRAVPALLGRAPLAIMPPPGCPPVQRRPVCVPVPVADAPATPPSPPPMTALRINAGSLTSEEQRCRRNLAQKCTAGIGALISTADTDKRRLIDASMLSPTSNKFGEEVQSLSISSASF
eukprot:TRINITY_DN2921_c0_g1_i4.p1 TRINITY_DN2921_c0_g1~~TRINITY_DN2921_c0_g1_i4.p1  ORF type:complete len:340 (+),score=16.73 TRINITY_DN2921_c0_g1_i4:65-1021(+)